MKRRIQAIVVAALIAITGIVPTVRADEHSDVLKKVTRKFYADYLLAARTIHILATSAETIILPLRLPSSNGRTVVIHQDLDDLQWVALVEKDSRLLAEFNFDLSRKLTAAKILIYNRSGALNALKEDNEITFGVGFLWNLEPNPPVDPIETIYSGTDLEYYQELAKDPERIVVAVMDVGFDYNHPALNFRLVREQHEPGVMTTGWDFFEGDGLPGGAALNFLSHGTAVSAIATRGDDRIALLPILLNFNKFKEAIQFSKSRGARVINLSFGHLNRATYGEILEAMAAYPDLLFVTAAGNLRPETPELDNDKIPLYPSSFQMPNHVTVASTNSDGSLAAHSHYGRHSVHLAAPGVEIPVNGFWDYEDYVTGTSFAAPYVANIAARILLELPHLKPQEVLEIIQLTLRQPNSRERAFELKEKTIWGGIADPEFALRLARKKRYSQ